MQKRPPNAGGGPVGTPSAGAEVCVLGWVGTNPEEQRIETGQRCRFLSIAHYGDRPLIPIEDRF
jgi:hypothetical protein